MGLIGALRHGEKSSETLGRAGKKARVPLAVKAGACQGTRVRPAATAPREVLDDLEPDEPVFLVAPARLAASPGASDHLAGVAVLTSDRLAFVPGAPGSPPPYEELRGDALVDVLAELWAAVKPAVLTAFPMVKILLREPSRPSLLAARSRPGIEIPLQLVRRAFEARVPGWLGVELALPLPDPRPPFALFFQVGRFKLEARDWCGKIESHHGQARPRPELERPYALHYLLRPPPRPIVRLRGPAPRSGGGPLALGLDGPTIGVRETLLLPYESITRLRWAEGTALRKPRLVIGADDREWWIDPRDAYEAPRLLDAARLLSELSGAPLETGVGSIRSARIAGAAGAAAGIAAAIAHFFL